MNDDTVLECSEIQCESCSGAANVLVNVDGQLKCIECINGEKGCA